MDDKDCKLLLHVYEEKNITRAAERMHISQPALSYRLQQLEAEFGMPIFIKHGKGIKFTPEGEYLVGFARKMVLELRKVKDHMSNMANEVKGTLKLGVSNHFAHYKLPPLLKSFLDGYPDVNITLETGYSSTIYQLLNDETVDVGIISGNYQWFDQKYLIYRNRITVISKEKINLDDLPNLPRIHYRTPRHTANIKYKTDLLLPQVIEDWWQERFTQAPTYSMQVDNAESCKEMVRYGFGYAIIPRTCLKQHDNFHTIDLSYQNGQELSRNTWMHYKEASIQSSVVKTFVNYIKAFYLLDGPEEASPTP
ncbi:hypothetical protein AN963_00240 [Brevibacillus choshinensis]|uniref:HTH lysR-type domain-containing protein n=1 Tax=Brevibacillus choshinensis TaxID=54911 RepID=A0ABR5N9P7_BRECH|nr:LysR family transcriptional regulator [Brevibacillus choshinensis]KQL48289.1 hypothetical protein AN963_00240 [Brevibacillus choshinensis]